MNKYQRIVVWSAGGLLLIWAAVTVCHFFLFGLPADVHDTTYLSQDGVYQATLHEVNTGAAGSYCQVLLCRRKDQSESVVLVDGGWGFVSKVVWNSNRVLAVTTGLEGPPDATWPRTWRDVKIVYRS